jgi:hypothetical protein
MRPRLFAIALSVLCACNNNGDDGDDDDMPADIDAPAGTIDAPPGTIDAPTGACGNIAGRWGIQGSCGADICDITQTGCSTALNCGGGAASYTGSITGNNFTYSGTAGGGTPATCNGVLAGNTMSGSCTVGGFPCDFTGQRL